MELLRASLPLMYEGLTWITPTQAIGRHKLRFPHEYINGRKDPFVFTPWVLEAAIPASDIGTFLDKSHFTFLFHLYQVLES